MRKRASHLSARDRRPTTAVVFDYAPSNTSIGLFFARMPRRTLRRAVAGLFGPVEHFDGLSQACLAPSNTSTGCRRLVWAHRTLRRAVAGLFGPVEHFDEPPQACSGPSNTSTSCRRLVWPRRTLRRAAADYVPPKCVAEEGDLVLASLPYFCPRSFGATFGGVSSTSGGKRESGEKPEQYPLL